MRLRRMLVLVLALTTAGCPAAKGPKPADPKKVPPAADGGQRVTGTAPVAPTADVSGDVMLVARASSLDALLQAGTGYLVGQLPPPFGQMVQPQRVKEALLARLRLVGDLDRAVDTTRPMALAVLDPKVYGDVGLGALVLAAPVLDSQPLIDGLARQLNRHETTAWGDHTFGEPPKQVHLRLEQGHALLAGSAKALAGASRLLRPHLDRAPARGVWVRVEAERINKRYGKELSRRLSRLSRGGYLGVGALLNKRRSRRQTDKLLDYVRGLRGLELLMRLDPQQIRLRAEATTQPSGAMARYLAQLGHGPAWGAKYLPAESAMLMLARTTPAAQRQALIEALDAFNGLLALMPGKLGAELKQYPGRWRKSLEGLIAQITGVGASAVWATADGGLGFGAAYQAKDPAAAQRATVAALETFGKDIDRLLKLAAKRWSAKQGKRGISGVGLVTRVRRGAFRHGALRGDLVQLSLRFPRLNKRSAKQIFGTSLAEGRAKLKRFKAGLRTLFGPTGTVAVIGTTSASNNKICLAVAGRDYKKRLVAMLETAAGKGTSGLEKTVTRLAGSEPLSMFFYAPLASLVEQSLRVTDQIVGVPAQIKGLVHRVLPPSGRDVPLGFWIRKGNNKLVFEGALSSDLVGLFAKGAMTLLTRGSVPMPSPSVRPTP